MNLPYAMRKSRRARPLYDCKEAWYYIDTRHIIVVAESDGVTTQVSLTKRQIEGALKLMNSVE